jgi:DNA-binding NarL/FixJ family response regulator
VLVALTRLLADMVERVAAGYDDVAVVGRAASGAEVAELVRTVDANVIVAGLGERGISSLYRELLFDRPRVRVFGVTDHDGETYLYVLRPEEIALGPLSPEEMLQAIRNGAPCRSPV